MRLTRTLSAVIVGGALASACAVRPVPGQPQERTPITEEVVIDSADVPLAATILSPRLTAKFGVVLLPGSGPAPRAQLQTAAQRLAGAGVTALIFDKRGSGDSGGDWRMATLDDLARDAIAAADTLRARGAAAVGFLAHSQGNWVATRAAELGASPAFLVALSGGGLAPRAVESYGYEQRMAARPAEDRRAALALVDAYFDYLSGAASRGTLDEQLALARAQSWYGPLGLERVLVSEQSRPYWQWVAQYDPAAAAAERAFPCLVMLGGADHVIPVDATVSAWRRQLAGPAAAASRLIIWPGRDHHLNLAAEHGSHGLTTDERVWRVVEQWLAGL